jgi:radical SAM superfamily enzyme YgiQ (UPF0313 family)
MIKTIWKIKKVKLKRKRHFRGPLFWSPHSHITIYHKKTRKREIIQKKKKERERERKWKKRRRYSTYHNNRNKTDAVEKRRQVFVSQFAGQRVAKRDRALEQSLCASPALLLLPLPVYCTRIHKHISPGTYTWHTKYLTISISTSLV